MLGAARDALGDQWEAALLAGEHPDRAGLDRIEPGQILLTGALGRMIPAQPGACTASTTATWGTLAINVLP